MRGALSIVGAVVALTIWSVEAAVIDGSWQIVLRDADKTGVYHAHKAAVAQLQEAFLEGIGLRLPIVERSKADRTKKSIFIGPEAAADAGFSTEGFGPFENIIAEKDGNVYLFGHDRPARNRPMVEAPRCILPSLKATARFMEKYMSVRFVMPYSTGMAVKKSAAIEVPDGTFERENPVMEFGGGWTSAFYSLQSGIMGSGVFYCWGGHSYTHMVSSKEYYKDHPEYFGLIRGVRFRDPHNEVLCISNPDVKKIIVDYLVKVFDEGAEVCELGPADSVLHCECDRCRAFYGTGDDWCEKYWCFHRDIAAEAYKLRPDKKVCIVCYGQTATPPKTFTGFTPNVMIETCRYEENDFRIWDRHDVKAGFYAYIYLWGNYKFLGFTPRRSCRSVHETARCLVKNGVKGVFRCGYFELPGLEGPAYWVFNRTLSNADLDVRAAVDEYCDYCYGDAATPMRKFHGLIDARLAVETFPSARPLDAIAYLYTPETLKALEEALGRAEAVKTLSKKERTRLGIVRTEFDYLKNLASIATTYAAYRLLPTRESFEPVAKLVKERNAMLDWLYSGKNGAMRAVEGYPELRYFKSESRAILATNGRSSGIIGAPLGWDVDFLREKDVLPGAKVNRLSVPRTAERPPLGDFESGAWAKAAWQDLGGVQLQKIAKKGRFKVLAGEDALYVGVESELADDCVVKTYDRDSEVYCDENIDLMVDPTGTRDVAYHLIWSPVAGSAYDAALGLISDALDPYYGKFYPYWDSKDWTHEDSRKDNVWRSLVRVPYAMMKVSAPKPGEKWCFNLGREWDIARHGKPPFTDALWNPNLESPSFASPAAMGEIIFE